MEEVRGTKAAKWPGGQNTEQKKSNHKLSLTMRRSCSMTGITDVCSFDEQEIVMDTELGGIILTGEDLHITQLSLETGDVAITGKIDSIKYFEGAIKKSGESLWKRIWK